MGFHLGKILFKLKASVFSCLSVHTSALGLHIKRLYLEHLSDVLVFDEKDVIQKTTGYSDKEIFIYPEKVSAADII